MHIYLLMDIRSCFVQQMHITTFLGAYCEIFSQHTSIPLRTYLVVFLKHTNPNPLVSYHSYRRGKRSAQSSSTRFI